MARLQGPLAWPAALGHPAGTGAGVGVLQQAGQPIQQGLTSQFLGDSRCPSPSGVTSGPQQALGSEG